MEMYDFISSGSTYFEVVRWRMISEILFFLKESVSIFRKGCSDVNLSQTPKASLASA